MIVKDEEKHLAECIESVKGVVDEIVIVDTGSTDSTIEIAEKYGANIYHFDWCNDFSKARNFALSKSKSDWILYLDADERLDKHSGEILRKTIKSSENVGLRCKILNIDEVNKKPKLQRYTRLFKNKPGIEFRGKAHEQIDGSLLENNYRILNSEILINHLGYNISRDELKKKAERNLKLLQEEYKEKPSGYCAFQIGNSYNILENDVEANKYYGLALNDKRLPREYKSLSLSYCSEFDLNNGRPEEAVKKINEAVKTHPENIISNLVASEIFFRQQQNENAVLHCIKAYELNEASRQQKSGANLIEIYQAPEKIIYHGLNISVKSNNPEGIEYFFTNLEKLKISRRENWEGEAGFIQKISQNIELQNNEINSFIGILSDDSLAFYLSLLSKYKNTISKPLIMKGIVIKFPGSIQSRNLYGVSLSEANRLDEAAEYFQKILNDSSSDDSAPVFHLLSIFLRQKNISALEDLIEKSKTQFAGDAKVINYINGLEAKLRAVKMSV